MQRRPLLKGAIRSKQMAMSRNRMMAELFGREGESKDVLASGFSLIFGLMRVVNMAHGSLYLLGGYQTDFARNFTREGKDFADLATSGLPFADWIRTLTERRYTWTPPQWQDPA